MIFMPSRISSASCGREGCTEESLPQRRVNDHEPAELLAVTLSRPPPHLPLLFLQRDVYDDEPAVIVPVALSCPPLHLPLLFSLSLSFLSFLLSPSHLLSLLHMETSAVAVAL